MSPQDLRSRLQSIFSSILEDDGFELTDSVSMGDVESWDSFNHINLMLAIEDEFGVEFTADEIAELLSVGQIVAGLERRVASTGA